MKSIHSITQIPGLLAHIPDPPKILYAQGNLSLLGCNDSIYVCIVGPRKSSPYGQDVTRSILEQLSRMNVITVSGIAYGIDSIVHTLSLQYGIPTIAIPGSGIDDESFYPRAHLDLKHEIIDKGGLIMSEFDPKAKADVWTFPIRNRIMAGLAHLTIVVEAEQRSGTLITAHLAIDYNREVLAVPGSIFSETSAGTHELISKGAEILKNMETLTEVLEKIAERDGIELWKKDVDKNIHIEESITVIPQTQKEILENLTPGEKQIYDCIQSHSDGITKLQIGRVLDMTSSEVSIYVTMLELHGLVKMHMGKVWTSL